MDAEIAIGRFRPYHAADDNLCNAYIGTIRTMTMHLEFVAFLPRDDSIPGKATYNIVTEGEPSAPTEIGVGIEIGFRTVAVQLVCPGLANPIYATLRPSRLDEEQMELMWPIPVSGFDQP